MDGDRARLALGHLAVELRLEDRRASGEHEAVRPESLPLDLEGDVGDGEARDHGDDVAV